MAIRPTDKAPHWSTSPTTTVCTEPNQCDCPPPPLDMCMDGVIRTTSAAAGLGQLSWCETNNGWDILILPIDWYNGTDGQGGQNAQPLVEGAHCSVVLKCTEEGNCGGQGGVCTSDDPWNSWTEGHDLWWLQGSIWNSTDQPNPFPNNDILWYDGWCDPVQNPDESPGRGRANIRNRKLDFKVGDRVIDTEPT